MSPSGLSFVIQAGMLWVIFTLSIQTLAGLMLASRPLSLNVWEPNQGMHGFRDWLAIVTGVVFLLGAGLGWYGYAHNRICWGHTGLPAVKLSVDMIAVVLLYFVYFGRRSTSSSGPTDED